MKYPCSLINGPRLLANATLLAARRAVTASLKDEGTLEFDCQPLQHYVSNPLKEGSSFFLEGVQRDSPPGRAKGTDMVFFSIEASGVRVENQVGWSIAECKMSC